MPENKIPFGREPERNPEPLDRALLAQAKERCFAEPVGLNLATDVTPEERKAAANLMNYSEETSETLVKTGTENQVLDPAEAQLVQTVIQDAAEMQETAAAHRWEADNLDHAANLRLQWVDKKTGFHYDRLVKLRNEQEAAGVPDPKVIATVVALDEVKANIKSGKLQTKKGKAQAQAAGQQEADKWKAFAMEQSAKLENALSTIAQLKQQMTETSGVTPVPVTLPEKPAAPTPHAAHTPHTPHTPANRRHPKR